MTYWKVIVISKKEFVIVKDEITYDIFDKDLSLMGRDNEPVPGIRLRVPVQDYYKIHKMLADYYC